MRAMVLDAARTPLRPADVPESPRLGPLEIRIRVRACGVCRTDLHLLEGDLSPPRFPIILGHEIVGTVTESGVDATQFREGDRVGVPWLGWACGACPYCRSGRENLCDRARFTGYQIDGGYAESTIADARFAFPIPRGFTEAGAAPLLCAGMIGYRALRFGGAAERIGFYGFGAAAHLAAQIARHRGQQVYAFTRPGDHSNQEFARRLGAIWAGGSDERPPELLDAALIFAPIGPLLPAALAVTRKGGMVVCAGIHMSDIPSFPYELLWGERTIRSVANLTRKDGEEFLAAAVDAKVETTTTIFSLPEANAALVRLRDGGLQGSVVIVP